VNENMSDTDLFGPNMFDVELSWGRPDMFGVEAAVPKCRGSCLAMWKALAAWSHHSVEKHCNTGVRF